MKDIYENKLIFIFEKGWRKIVTPDGEVIQLTSCDDGCKITVEGDITETVKKLNNFIGYEIVEVMCDSATIWCKHYLHTVKATRHRAYETWYDAIFINAIPIGKTQEQIIEEQERMLNLYK